MEQVEKQTKELSNASSEIAKLEAALFNTKNQVERLEKKEDLRKTTETQLIEARKQIILQGELLRYNLHNIYCIFYHHHKQGRRNGSYWSEASGAGQTEMLDFRGNLGPKPTLGGGFRGGADLNAQLSWEFRPQTNSRGGRAGAGRIQVKLKLHWFRRPCIWSSWIQN